MAPQWNYLQKRFHLVKALKRYLNGGRPVDMKMAPFFSFSVHHHLHTGSHLDYIHINYFNGVTINAKYLSMLDQDISNDQY